MDGGGDVQPGAEVIDQLIQHIPEEQRNLPTGKAIVEMLGAIFAGGWKFMTLRGFQAEQRLLSELLSILDNHTKSHEEAIKAAAEHQKKNWKIFDKVWKKCRGSMPQCKPGDNEANEKFRMEYSKAVKSIRMEIANGMLKQCVLSSGVVVISQYFALKAIWKQIGEATNMITDSRQRMQDEMEKIERLIGKLRGEQQQFSICLLEGVKFGKMKVLLDGMEDIVRDIADGILKMQRMIVDCRVELNGKRQALINTDDAMTISLVTNSAHFGINLLQFMSGALLGSTAWVVAAGVMLTLHAGVLGGGVVTKLATKKTIKECTRFYAELVRWETQADKLSQELKEVKEWIKRIRDSFEEGKWKELFLYQVICIVLVAMVVYFYVK